LLRERRKAPNCPTPVERDPLYAVKQNVLLATNRAACRSTQVASGKRGNNQKAKENTPLVLRLGPSKGEKTPEFSGTRA